MTEFPDDNPSSGMFELVEAVEPPHRTMTGQRIGGARP